jgi:hypothetical protein
MQSAFFRTITVVRDTKYDADPLNSNCLECPKGGLGYESVAQLQDVLGPSSGFLSDRRGGQRIRLSLRMLRLIDEPKWHIRNEPLVQCGGLCELQEALLHDQDVA